MNIMLIVVGIFLLYKVVDGYKKGMVKEIISFISLIIMCVVAVLLANALHSYLEQEIVSMIVMVLLLLVVGLLHHALGLVFFSAKLLSKLPVIHWLDKLLGIVVGVMETVLILWTVYTFIMYFEMGMIGEQILAYTKESPILTALYQYNYLAVIAADLLERVPAGLLN